MRSDRSKNKLELIQELQMLRKSVFSGESEHSSQKEINLNRIDMNFKNLFEWSNDGIYILKGNKFVFANPSFTKMTGYTFNELNANNFSFESMFTEKGLATVNDREKRRQSGEKVSSHFIFEALKKSGQKREFQVSVNKIIWNGETALMGMLKDVTERIKESKILKDALKKAQEGEKVKAQFLANMSHEIRTPLNCIMGFTSLIEMKIKNNIGEEEQEFIDTVNKSCQRLLRSVHEILDMSQIKSNTLTAKIEEFSLNELVELAARPLFSKIKEKNLSLRINTASAGMILTDKNLTVQAISNILDNAVKYTPKGRIDIDIQDNLKTIQLSIKDTGIGISKKFIKDIFNVFTQESSGYNKKYQGLGLGLSLAMNYLELCNTSISIKSKKNKGSTFMITFKKAITQPKKTNILTTLEKTPKIKANLFLDRPLVLVVEDDQNSQKLIKYFLRDLFELKFAKSVIAAQRKLKQFSVNLVLLDLSLVGKYDGLDLVKYMRKKTEMQKIPVIATTAHAQSTDINVCLEEGCNEFISKPIIREKLLEKINKHLNYLLND